MAEKEDNSPSPLKDTNSVDEYCSVCLNVYSPHTDSDGNDFWCEKCDTNKVKHICHTCMETTLYYYNKNAHDVEVISDSSLSSDSELDFLQNLDETDFLFKHLTMKRQLCKSLTFEKRVERDSDTDEDYTDMPPLEEAKKTNFDTDEDSDELPPLEPGK